MVVRWGEEHIICGGDMGWIISYAVVINTEMMIVWCGGEHIICYCYS